jgi:ribosomal-protein-alanine N-acetyltransferase
MLTIETERLVIRPFEPNDLLPIHHILDLAFGGPAGPDDSQALRERESWLRWSILSQEWLPKLHQPPYGDLAVVLKSTGVLIGAVGLVPLLGPFHQIPQLRGSEEVTGRYSPEFGLYWVIDPGHQRRGYASEAGRAVARFGFNDLQLGRILATKEHGNAASQAVMRKLGMVIARNPLTEPEWMQVVGILCNQAWAPAAFHRHMLD